MPILLDDGLEGVNDLPGDVTYSHPEQKSNTLPVDCKSEAQPVAPLRGVARSYKAGWTVRVGCPLPSWGVRSGIQFKAYQYAPQQPSSRNTLWKKWGGRVHPVAMPLAPLCLRRNKLKKMF